MAEDNTLIPPDPKRCQTEIHTYNPFTMGGKVNRTERCTNVPVVIASETKPAADGLAGSMSICTRCLIVFLQQRGLDGIELKEVK